MALFEVPGWTIPSASLSSLDERSKKRKRPSGDGVDRVRSATVNVEKLMKRLKESDKQTRKPRKKTQSGKGGERFREGKVVWSKPYPSQNQEEQQTGPMKTQETNNPRDTGSSLLRNTKNRAEKGNKQTGATAAAQSSSNPEASLTSMQREMKQSLDGARFRWINEVLYKSVSTDAHKMMQEDPSVYMEYHTGFRHQVRLWPTNPVIHYIDSLSLYPRKTVVADLGCGEAALARALNPKGLVVLSFDLVSDGSFVVETDICRHVPLPGSDSIGDGEERISEGQVVDVVVCALSLMGTNWLGCVREAWRILKVNGELKIAEVASRFTNVDEFVSLICSVGFSFNSKDERNSHFTLFEFKKVEMKWRSEKAWSKLFDKGDVLKACEYKRR